MNEESTVKKRRPIRRRALAITLAIAICMSALLAGTFAWSAISQMALNEAVENDMAPGGRLHDDFNGKNLDIYVENYGTNSIYAKVKILEYMEIGDGAGKKGAYDPNEIQDDGISKGVWGIDSDNNATSIKTGAKIGDTSTWTVHAPVAGVDDCGTAGGGGISPVLAMGDGWSEGLHADLQQGSRIS